MFLKSGEYYIKQIKIFRVVLPDALLKNGNINTKDKQVFEFLDKITLNEKTLNLQDYISDKQKEYEAKYKCMIEMDIVRKYKLTDEEDKLIGEFYLNTLKAKGACSYLDVSIATGFSVGTVQNAIRRHFAKMGLGR